MRVQRWAWTVWFDGEPSPIMVVAADEERAVRVARGVWYGHIGDDALITPVKRCRRGDPADTLTHMTLAWDCHPDQRGD